MSTLTETIAVNTLTETITVNTMIETIAVNTMSETITGKHYDQEHHAIQLLPICNL